jgi:hypothetical protein
MKNLSKIVLAKIVITAAFWVVPLLLLPHSLLTELGVGVENGTRSDLEPIRVFMKLLGMAYVALLVSYVFGYLALREKIYPRGMVWTGIVSNAGACALLLLHASAWSRWDNYAPWLMWASVLATGFVAIGLVVFGPCCGNSA